MFIFLFILVIKCRCLNIIGALYNETGDNMSAITKYNKSIEIMKQIEALRWCKSSSSHNSTSLSSSPLAFSFLCFDYFSASQGTASSSLWLYLNTRGPVFGGSGIRRSSIFHYVFLTDVDTGQPHRLIYSWPTIKRKQFGDR